MAKLTLGIYGLSVSQYTVKDSNGNEETKDKKDITLSTGDSKVEDSITKKMSVEVKNSTTNAWDSKTEEVTLKFSIGEFGYQQQMYQPDEITAQISITVSSSSYSTSDIKQSLKKDEVLDIFSQKKVSLTLSNTVDSKETTYTVGEDFYIHEVSVRRASDAMYVVLKIYSPDKLMTTAKYCRTWTAKRLESDILTDKENGQLKNYKFPYDSSKQLECDFTNVKHVQKVETTTSTDSNGNKTTTQTCTEHRFPYLVQYNESFYDFLARTTNRWGEFMYYYNGKLRFGYDEDETNAKEIDNYNEVIYLDSASTTPKQEKKGKLVSEAQYESDVLNSKVTKDSWAQVMGTINTGFSGSQKKNYWISKIPSILNMNDYVLNWFIGTIVQDLYMWLMMEVKAKQKNSKFNKKYFTGTGDDKAKYVSMESDQYDSKKETWNQQSEINPILDPDQYAKSLVGEIMAAKNTIEIDYDTYAPSLHIGQLIKLDGDCYIVSEITSKQKSEDSYTYKDSTKTVEKETTTSQVFTVKAIAKVSLTLDETDSNGNTIKLDGFYPTILPTGHIRQTGPQMAVVVDATDPRKCNRVRIMYPWQLTSLGQYENIMSDQLKNFDITDASPWLLYTSPNGPSMSGVHARHYKAEKVLVNYLNDNIERPYVVGAASTSVPPGLVANEGAAIMSSPYGQSIKVHDGNGKGVTAFFEGLLPALSTIGGFVDYGDWFGDNETSKSFEGGVDMGDKFGIWSISASTDKRSVSINSSWGSVSVSAFSGINISAPNGDIKISGKNVSIEAGNNLTLESGANIENQFIQWGKGIKKKSKGLTLKSDIQTALVKKLGMMLVMVCDISIIRQLIQVFWKPKEGLLSIQSGRYLMLSAGGAKAGYPDAAYKDKDTYMSKAAESLGMQVMEATMMCKETTELVGKIDRIVDYLKNNYKEEYRKCLKKKEEFIATIGEQLFELSESRTNKVEDICKSWSELKSTFWNPNTTEIKIEDLGFKDVVQSDNKEDVKVTSQVYQDTRKKIAPELVLLKLSQEKREKTQQKVLDLRKEAKDKVKVAADALLKSIKDLRTPPAALTEEDLKNAPFLGSTFKKLDEDRVNELLKAFTDDSVKNSTFYKFCYNDTETVTDARADMNDRSDAFEVLSGWNGHEVGLARQVAVALFEKWGLESKEIKKKIKDGKVVDMDNEEQAAKPDTPKTNEDFENDAKWELYTLSLMFKDEEKEKLMGGPGNTWKIQKKMIKEGFTSIKTDIWEHNCWSKPKHGEILFGVGMTYHLKKDGSISPLDTTYNSAPISKSNLNDVQQNELMQQFVAVRKAFKNVGMKDNAQPPVANNAMNVPAVGGAAGNAAGAVNAGAVAEKQTTLALISSWGGINP